jgi:Zn-dependent protease
LPDINFAQILIAFVVLVFSLTVHESAHAWAASRLGDPTGWRMGRVSLNPAVHIDLVGTLLFPLIAMVTHLPIIGWADPSRRMRDTCATAARLPGHRGGAAQQSRLAIAAAALRWCRQAPVDRTARRGLARARASRR